MGKQYNILLMLKNKTKLKHERQVSQVPKEMQYYLKNIPTSTRDCYIPQIFETVLLYVFFSFSSTYVCIIPGTTQQTCFKVNLDYMAMW